MSPLARRKETMHIIHGTWVPEPHSGEFVQGGGFYLWVETAIPSGGHAPQHPRHLPAASLAPFLIEHLGLTGAVAVLQREMRPLYLLLPSSDRGPLPSFELLPYCDDELPEGYHPAPWQVCGYRLSPVLARLKALHFVAQREEEEFRLGADLLFWYQYAQVLKGIVARDHYVPALRYRAQPQEEAPTRGPKAATRKTTRVTAPSYALYHGWELLSPAYDEALQRYAPAMPPVCAAAALVDGSSDLYGAESLLRHFSDCVLRAIVVGTPTSAAFENKVAGTLLYGCLYPDHPTALSSPWRPTLDDYYHWVAWHAGLKGGHTAAAFTLCLRLDEAPAEAPDEWQLHFLVAARRDPSLRLPLADYWGLPPGPRDAVRQRYGAHFEQQVLLALGGAARIYPKIWEGLETDRPTGVSLTLDEAFDFLKETAWVLEDSGCTVIVPAWWTPEGRRRVRLRLTTAQRSSAARGTTAPSRGQLSLETLISYQYQLAIGDQAVSADEWQALVTAKSPLVQFRGEWMELDREKMGELLEFWQRRQEVQPELTMLDLIKIAGEPEGDLEWVHDHALEEMLDRLHDKDSFAPIADPPHLHGTLRDYQKRGVAWLRYLEQLGLNPCLADDMGLGKTISVIAHLVSERDERDGVERAPTLVVAPTSVVSNWRREIERFAPDLRVAVHQGATRLKGEAAFKAHCADLDVLVTSYPLVRLDEKLLRTVRWHRVVIDEAQNIKNPQAAQTRAIVKLPATHRLALTGTPVENRLRDLWSIFHFLNPGYLGKEAQFRKAFELPIQRDNDPERATTLKRLVEPFILRRVKTDKNIIDDLPDKIEDVVYCTLTTEQAALYEAVVKDVTEQLDASDGIARQGLMLSALTRLKQVCNHPAQFLHDGSSFSPERSHKLARLSEMIDEALQSGDSMLVFTQFTEIGEALERYLAQTLHCTTYYLHGGTSVKRREAMVTAFQDPSSPPAAFILSLRAGGVGLTLTKANHVFHFDRWWNPAVEDQATDRAFRIGQRNNVFVHKFTAIGTLEERISALIDDKKRLSSAIVGADESWLTDLDNETFRDLIALRRGALGE